MMTPDQVWTVVFLSCSLIGLLGLVFGWLLRYYIAESRKPTGDCDEEVDYTFTQSLDGDGVVLSFEWRDNDYHITLIDDDIEELLDNTDRSDYE